MRHALLLALRYMAYHRLRSAILVICVSIAIFLPIAVHVLVDYYNRLMIERADATPLVIGAKGSPYDLVLGTVYFKGRVEQHTTMAQADRIAESRLATPVPIYARYSAGGEPIVGTSLEYFDFRGLNVAEGTLPQLAGDVVLGARAARRLGVTVDDRLLSQREKVYDVGENPLKLRVAGVLAHSGTADDLVIFADVKTVWIIEGIGHGHDATQAVTDLTLIADATEDRRIFNPALAKDSQVTAELLERFHFHGDEAEFPITAVIALPHDAKSATILTARYRNSDDVQAVVPREVVGGMMDVVFRAKRFFDAVFVTVLISTALFLVLVMMLSVRIRRREFQTLQRIGCSRWTVAAMQAGEIAILLAASLVVAAAALGGLMWYVVRFEVLL